MYRKISTSSELSATDSGYFSNDSTPEPTSPPRHPQIRLVLERDGWPTDYDWQNPDLREKALSYGAARFVELLLEKSCPVVGHSTRKPEPRDFLRDMSWPVAIENLATLGATLNDRNCRGDTAVHLGLIHDATSGSFQVLLPRYLRRAKANLANSDGLTLLHVACAKAPMSLVVEMLRKFGKDVNRQVSLVSRTATRTKFPGFTPLHVAVFYNRVDVARLLLEHGADLCVPDRTCTTPLHLALYCDNTDMIDCILEYDRKWENCVNDHGLTHFMAACAGTNASVAEQFLRFAQLKHKLPPLSTINLGVVKSTNREFAGYTAFHFAAKSGNAETTRLLLEYGAPTHAKTAANETPLTLAHKEDKEKVVRLIQLYTDKQQRFDNRRANVMHKPIVGRSYGNF